MKAAILKAFGSPLTIETIPDPTLGTGEVIVDVAASRVLAYAGEVFSGERKYLLELPLVPGPARSAGCARPGPMRHYSPPAIGSIAIRPYARAIMRSRPTSRCKA